MKEVPLVLHPSLLLETMSKLVEQLEKDGIHCNTVSCGSTPACSLYKNWKGITEIHPGNYCCYDRYTPISSLHK